jgi:hypothetical protein
MSIHLAICCICSLVFGTIVDAYAASTLKLTCSGELTDTRKDGITTPDPTSTGDHRKLYKVLEVWSVDKR